jgi:hypothetical protein
MSPNEPAGKYGWTSGQGVRGWMHNVIEDPPGGTRQTQIAFAVVDDCFANAPEAEPTAVTVAGLDGLYLEPNHSIRCLVDDSGSSVLSEQVVTGPTRHTQSEVSHRRAESWYSWNFPIQSVRDPVSSWTTTQIKSPAAPAALKPAPDGSCGPGGPCTVSQFSPSPETEIR